MNKNIIIFSSQTYALKSRELLKKNNIKSSIIRTPVNIKVSSCGYSLYVPDRLSEALKIIRNSNIAVLGVYAVDEK